MGLLKSLFLLLPFTGLVNAQQPVLLKGHSHNDYKHRQPLFDALDNGFFSVEADVFYEDGSFIVAHTSAGKRQKNTLYAIVMKDNTYICRNSQAIIIN